MANADTAGSFRSADYALASICWLAMYRDLIGSIAPGKPQWDGEFHFANERRIQPEGYVEAVYWQAYIHGLSGSYAWQWYSVDDAALLYDAKVLVDVGRTALNIRRLADEIVAFRDVEPWVALLYSIASTPHTEDRPADAPEPVPGHFNAIYSGHWSQTRQAYEGLFFEGVKVGFVSERQVEAGKLSDYDMLIVPAVSYVNPEVIEQV